MKKDLCTPKLRPLALSLSGCLIVGTAFAAGGKPAVLDPQGAEASFQISEPVLSRRISDVVRERPAVSAVDSSNLGLPIPNQIRKFADFRPLVFNPAVRAVQPPLLAPAPAPSLSYNALRQGDSNVGAFFPPDTTADVGNNEVLQWVNIGWAVFNKTTGVRSGPYAGNVFWDAFPANNDCRTSNDGDPLVLFDKIAQRWVVSQFAINDPIWYQCVAVSTTSDPLGTYNLYQFQYPNFNDYGKMGVWVTKDGSQNAYTFSMHEFTGSVGTPSFVGGTFSAAERDKMLAGQPAKFVRTAGGQFGMVPLSLESTTALPAGSCPNFVHFDGSGTGYRFWDYCINWSSNTATLANVNGTLVASQAFNLGLATDPVQRDANVALDSFDGNTMYRPSIRAFAASGPTEAYAVVTHTVNSGTVAAPKAGARWVQFGLSESKPSQSPTALFTDGLESGIGGVLTRRVVNEGTIAPDAIGRFMTAGNMDQNGNLAVGFTASGPNNATGVNPEVRYTARKLSDPAGAMMEEQSCTTGINGPYTGGSQAGRPSRRWGDYSMVMIDPTDQCTFHVTNEYAPAGTPNNWSTRICSFKFADCGTADFIVEAPAERFKVCKLNPARPPIRVAGLGAGGGAVALTSSGFPAGVAANLTPNSVSAGGVATVELTGIAGLANGTYSGTVTGTAGANVRSTTLNFEIASASPTAITGISPAANSNLALPRETFSWTSAGAGADYFIEIARDAAFNQIFETARVATTSFTNTRLLTLGTQYFWRVTPINACGSGTPTASATFTTVTSLASCPSGTTPNIRFADDVSGDLAWTVDQNSGTPPTQWAKVVPPAGTGLATRAWYATNSAVTADQFVTSPDVTLPATGLMLFSFDAHHQYETVEPTGPNCWDGGSIEVSVNSGAFTALGNDSNVANPYLGRRDAATTLPGTDAWCVQPTPGTAARTVFSLNAYRGQTVKLRFRSTADTNTVGPVPNGWAFDNVEVRACQ